MIHEDERRTLEDWPEAKIITAKKDCVLGQHYHMVKTERFILTDGQATITINGHSTEMNKGDVYSVHPMQMHSLSMKEGSMLIGLCSHPYDKNDDYR